MLKLLSAVALAIALPAAALAQSADPASKPAQNCMDHSKMAGMDHSKMGHSSTAGMGHGSMAGMDMSGMDHSNMAGMDHSKMAGNCSTPSKANPPSAHQGQSGH